MSKRMGILILLVLVFLLCCGYGAYWWSSMDLNDLSASESTPTSRPYVPRDTPGVRETPPSSATPAASEESKSAEVTQSGEASPSAATRQDHNTAPNAALELTFTPGRNYEYHGVNGSAVCNLDEDPDMSRCSIGFRVDKQAGTVSFTATDGNTLPMTAWMRWGNSFNGLQNKRLNPADANGFDYDPSQHGQVFFAVYDPELPDALPITTVFGKPLDKLCNSGCK